MVPWRSCGMPWTSLSQRRTSSCCNGSSPACRTRSTHSSSVRPVRSCIDAVPAAVLSAGSMPPIMPNDGSRRRGVHDEVGATTCRVGEEQGLSLLGPTAPVGQICLGVALDAPPETDISVGLQPDEHRLEVRVPSRARAHTFHEQEGRGGEVLPVGIVIVLPVPSPVCRPLAACDRGQDPVSYTHLTLPT